MVTLRELEGEHMQLHLLGELLGCAAAGLVDDYCHALRHQRLLLSSEALPHLHLYQLQHMQGLVFLRVETSTF